MFHSVKTAFPLIRRKSSISCLSASRNTNASIGIRRSWVTIRLSSHQSRFERDTRTILIDAILLPSTLLLASAFAVSQSTTRKWEEAPQSVRCETSATSVPRRTVAPSNANLPEAKTNHDHSVDLQSSNILKRTRSLHSKSLSEKYNVDWTQILGEGAYGSVHPARLALTGEKVALKKISKRYTDTSSFRNETDALVRIYNNGGHPNISGLRDMYEDTDYYYLVMDLVSGGEMFDHLIQYGAYSEADAARLMQEVASALAFLHGVGVVHADLKPENLLLCSKKRVDGTIKMIDFGCAIVEDERSDDDGSDYFKKGSTDRLHEDENSDQTMPLYSTGTTAYWPPERFTKKRIVPNAAGDMWAVGVILFIMLTGVHPFDLTGVATDAEIADRIKKDPSPPNSPRLTGHLSPAAIDLIQKLFAKNPDERITASQMLHHPWITGDEAATEIIQESAERLSRFKDLRSKIEAEIFSILIANGNNEMPLSEYTPNMIYQDDERDRDNIKRLSPATSVLKKVFESFDDEQKGYISADDLARVVKKLTGEELTENDKIEMMAATAEEPLSVGLSLSDFSRLFAGLKHKHYPRGHIVFNAGDEGDAMYFINSGKVEIQTRKGQLVYILRHGDFFGEGSLLQEHNKRFSTARCATPVDVIKIKKSDFQRYIRDSKSARDNLKFRWRARLVADAKNMIRLQTNVRELIYKDGDVVYKEGDLGKSMYFVDEKRGGKLEVRHGDVAVHYYCGGESFGESSLLLARPRSSTVICVSDTCVLHELHGSDFLAFLEKNSETKEMIQNVCRKRLFKRAVKAYLTGQKRGFGNDDLLKVFNDVDADKSGYLSLDEIRHFMHAMDTSITEEDLVQLMKYIDVDEDGKVSIDDFRRLFRQFNKIMD